MFAFWRKNEYFQKISSTCNIIEGNSWNKKKKRNQNNSYRYYNFAWHFKIYYRMPTGFHLIHFLVCRTTYRNHEINLPHTRSKKEPPISKCSFDFSLIVNGMLIYTQTSLCTYDVYIATGKALFSSEKC